MFADMQSNGHEWACSFFLLVSGESVTKMTAPGNTTAIYLVFFFCLAYFRWPETVSPSQKVQRNTRVSVHRHHRNRSTSLWAISSDKHNMCLCSASSHTGHRCPNLGMYCNFTITKTCWLKFMTTSWSMNFSFIICVVLIYPIVKYLQFQNFKFLT